MGGRPKSLEQSVRRAAVYELLAAASGGTLARLIFTYPFLPPRWFCFHPAF